MTPEAGHVAGVLWLPEQQLGELSRWISGSGKAEVIKRRTGTAVQSIDSAGALAPNGEAARVEGFFLHVGA